MEKIPSERAYNTTGSASARSLSSVVFGCTPLHKEAKVMVVLGDGEVDWSDVNQVETDAVLKTGTTDGQTRETALDGWSRSNLGGMYTVQMR